MLSFCIVAKIEIFLFFVQKMEHDVPLTAQELIILSIKEMYSTR